MRKKLEVTAKWYAIYTRPRWEKKVNSLLINKGVESYCPLNRVRRKWSDRIKTIEEPLFKSYVFVKIGEEARTEVRNVDLRLELVDAATQEAARELQAGRCAGAACRDHGVVG